jgi:hypothetical protein
MGARWLSSGQPNCDPLVLTAAQFDDIYVARLWEGGIVGNIIIGGCGLAVGAAVTVT